MSPLSPSVYAPDNAFLIWTAKEAVAVWINVYIVYVYKLELYTVCNCTKMVRRLRRLVDHLSFQSLVRMRS